jgi:hypothetical protein
MVEDRRRRRRRSSTRDVLEMEIERKEFEEGS